VLLNASCTLFFSSGKGKGVFLKEEGPGFLFFECIFCACGEAVFLSGGAFRVFGPGMFR
jgi:hypothetical protein